MEEYEFTAEEEKGLFKRREPFSFMLWLGIFGMALVFVALTFVYFSQKGRSDWEYFPMPLAFWLSTFLIIASSITLHLAKQKFKYEQFIHYRILMAATLVLGSLFVLVQILGWRNLVQMNIYLNGSPSGSFLYLLSGLHIVHILGGLFFLMIVFVESIKKPSYVDSFIYSVNPPNQLRLKLITIYWHFVDVLWLYLFIFLLINQS